MNGWTDGWVHEYREIRLESPSRSGRVCPGHAVDSVCHIRYRSDRLPGMRRALRTAMLAVLRRRRQAAAEGGGGSHAKRRGGRRSSADVHRVAEPQGPVQCPLRLEDSLGYPPCLFFGSALLLSYPLSALVGLPWDTCRKHVKMEIRVPLIRTNESDIASNVLSQGLRGLECRGRADSRPCSSRRGADVQNARRRAARGATMGAPVRYAWERIALRVDAGYS